MFKNQNVIENQLPNHWIDKIQPIWEFLSDAMYSDIDSDLFLDFLEEHETCIFPKGSLEYYDMKEKLRNLCKVTQFQPVFDFEKFEWVFKEINNNIKMESISTTQSLNEFKDLFSKFIKIASDYSIEKEEKDWKLLHDNYKLTCVAVNTSINFEQNIEEEATSKDAFLLIGINREDSIKNPTLKVFLEKLLNRFFGKMNKIFADFPENALDHIILEVKSFLGPANLLSSSTNPSSKSDNNNLSSVSSTKKFFISEIEKLANYIHVYFKEIVNSTKMFEIRDTEFHAEMNLIEGGDSYIGCSKLCCAACFISLRKRNILVKGVHWDLNGIVKQDKNVLTVLYQFSPNDNLAIYTCYELLNIYCYLENRKIERNHHLEDNNQILSSKLVDTKIKTEEKDELKSILEMIEYQSLKIKSILLDISFMRCSSSIHLDTGIKNEIMKKKELLEKLSSVLCIFPRILLDFEISLIVKPDLN